MLRRANGRVDGFVIEGPTAGGHNAPPRGKVQLNAAGEPIYGERDRVNLDELRALGVPFWLAGGYGNPEKVREALERGAAGVQVGTAFAFSRESGMSADLKSRLIDQARVGAGECLPIRWPRPRDFHSRWLCLRAPLPPFPIYEQRKRVCDLGYLREPYATGENKIGYRCSAEPVENYLAKGGKIEDTVGRKCLCNSLHGQHRSSRRHAKIMWLSRRWLPQATI